MGRPVEGATRARYEPSHGLSAVRAAESMEEGKALRRGVARVDPEERAAAVDHGVMRPSVGGLAVREEAVWPFEELGYGTDTQRVGIGWVV